MPVRFKAAAVGEGEEFRRFVGLFGFHQGTYFSTVTAERGTGQGGSAQITTRSAATHPLGTPCRLAVASGAGAAPLVVAGRQSLLLPCSR